MENGKSKKLYRKSKDEPIPKKIGIVEQYIRRKGKNPKFIRKASTLISYNHSKLAINKPLVMAIVQGRLVPILVDSGAE